MTFIWSEPHRKLLPSKDNYYHLLIWRPLPSSAQQMSTKCLLRTKLKEEMLFDRNYTSYGRSEKWKPGLGPSLSSARMWRGDTSEWMWRGDILQGQENLRMDSALFIFLSAEKTKKQKTTTTKKTVFWAAHSRACSKLSMFRNPFYAIWFSLTQRICMLMLECFYTSSQAWPWVALNSQLISSRVEGEWESL